MMDHHPHHQLLLSQSPTYQQQQSLPRPQKQPLATAAEATVPAVTIAPTAIAVEASIVPVSIAAAESVPATTIAAEATIPVATTALETAIAAEATAPENIIAPAAITAPVVISATPAVIIALVDAITTAEATTTAPVVVAVTIAAPTINTQAAATSVAGIALEVDTAPAAIAPSADAIAAEANSASVNDMYAEVTIPAATTAATNAPAATTTTVEATTTASTAVTASAAIIATVATTAPVDLNTTAGETEKSLLMKCLFTEFQYSSASVVDEERAVESCIKGLAPFVQFDKIDINYQGENIHGMFNKEATHIGPIGRLDLSTFQDRRGKVYNVTNLDVCNRTGGDDVVIVVAWKMNLKDTFGLFQILSFDEYLYFLENRLVCCILIARQAAYII